MALGQLLPQSQHQTETCVYVSEFGWLKPASEVAERRLWINHPHLVEQHPRPLPTKLDDGSPWRVAKGG